MACGSAVTYGLSTISSQMRCFDIRWSCFAVNIWCFTLTIVRCRKSRIWRWSSEKVYNQGESWIWVSFCLIYLFTTTTFIFHHFHRLYRIWAKLSGKNVTNCTNCWESIMLSVSCRAPGILREIFQNSAHSFSWFCALILPILRKFCATINDIISNLLTCF